MAEISAELNLKIAGLQAGLERARSEMAGFKKYAQAQGQGIGSVFSAGLMSGLKSIGGALGVAGGAGGMIFGLKSMAEGFDRIADAAASMNATTDGVQRLQYMAAGTLTPFDTMVSGLMRIRRALFEIDSETKQRALANIGLDATNFMSLDADQAFLQLARAYQEAQRSGKGFADVMALIKGASPDLFGALTTSTEALERMAQKSIASAETIRIFTENLGKLKMAGMEVSNSVTDIGTKMSRAMQMLMGGLSGIGGEGFMMGAFKKVDELASAERKAAEDAKALKKQVADAEIAEIERVKAAKKAAEDEKAAAARGTAQQEMAIKEARASGHNSQAEKMQRSLDFEKNKQKFLREGFDEEGATNMARREQAVADRMKHPGRIQGYKGSGGSKPGEGLDWLYGHNRDKGGQPMTKDFKFPGIDEMNRTLKVIEKHLE